MIRVVRPRGLGVSSTSIAHTCPAYGLPSIEGQWISASGTCPLRPAAGCSARSRRSECHQAWPWAQAGLACIHSRAARIARRCASRPSAGRVAGNPSPVAAMPSRVSQHHPGPGPSRPVAAYPARRHRAVSAGSRSGSTRSAAASRSDGAPQCSPTSSSPSMSRWDSRMLPASARRAGRAAAEVAVSCACAVVFISAFPACNRVPGCPRVFTDARDVTIFPRRRDTARAADAP